MFQIYPESISCLSRFSKLSGIVRLFLLPPSIRIAIASLTRPLRSIHRGESGKCLKNTIHSFGSRWILVRQIYLYKITMRMVGIEMAMYNSHQFSMKSEKTGRKISPIDQNNSKIIETIIRALPLVMSRTKNH